MNAFPLSPAWKELARQHRVWRREHHRLSVGPDFYRLMAENGRKRDGEVVLAIRRPDGLLLLHTKPFYPPDTWRMPTGGVEWGETPAEAARREIAEETGLPARPDRLLGVLTYEVLAEGETALVHFASAVFLALAPDETPVRHDPQEQISGYRWVAPAALREIAERLCRLPPDWEDWGRYRALAHLFTAAALEELPTQPLSVP